MMASPSSWKVIFSFMFIMDSKCSNKQKQNVPYCRQLDLFHLSPKRLPATLIQKRSCWLTWGAIIVYLYWTFALLFLSRVHTFSTLCDTFNQKWVSSPSYNLVFCNWMTCLTESLLKMCFSGSKSVDSSGWVPGHESAWQSNPLGSGNSISRGHRSSSVSDSCDTGIGTYCSDSVEGRMSWLFRKSETGTFKPCFNMCVTTMLAVYANGQW